ncbi:hypothetical protein XA68_15500 [Ophiocordyceps unilateralis]|uniref:Amino acid permease/ SLC12A domain-containing protein n=1 Tax=Ophiocordyceps unilateralis TaxID=268505 RepID=A0A2A9P716_OPHUN|nr:hypothetical protein XA68_15500 [Ophiocordyceps unilateralis]
MLGPWTQEDLLDMLGKGGKGGSSGQGVSQRGRQSPNGDPRAYLPLPLIRRNNKNQFPLHCLSHSLTQETESPPPPKKKNKPSLRFFIEAMDSTTPSSSGSSRKPVRTSSADDAAALERLGHKQELKRNLSMMSMLGLAFAIVNTWTALAASLSVALPSGGCSAVVWGLVTAGVCNLCLAASMAEFLSAYPTAGGQYHWAAIIAGRRAGRAIGFVTGWINVSGWVAVSASGGLLGSTFILNAIALLQPGYEPRSWHHFFLHAAITLFALAVNALGARLLPYVTNAALYWAIGGLVVTAITIVSCTAPNFQSGSFVYGSFINDVGWPDGVAWMLGLLQGSFALTGYDATAHMIEEMPDPQRHGPRVMLYAVLIGVVTGFFFVSCLLFCVQDVQQVVNAPYGPLLQIYVDATKSVAGSVCLVVIPIISVVFTTVTLLSVTSRMIYAFARDRGMPFSSVFARVQPGLDVPLNALFGVAGCCLVFACILVGSSSAMNAITAAAVVALGVTYAIPPAINVVQGRRMLPADRAFKLWEPLGWTVNIVGIAWTMLTTVLFVFPPRIPATAGNMNYCVVAFGFILLLAGLTWILDGRLHYRGPQVEGLVTGTGFSLVDGIAEGVDKGKDERQTGGGASETVSIEAFEGTAQANGTGCRPTKRDA